MSLIERNLVEVSRDAVKLSYSEEALSLFILYGQGFFIILIRNNANL